ncbi:helix-turn-helix domain-containing protein [Streptomyces canus]|uniref:helix-turn-helix domain-containing protein n=1 Tax=Streptomyces canus TaxID=58343 RepID=UPI0038140E12
MSVCRPWHTSTRCGSSASTGSCRRAAPGTTTVTEVAHVWGFVHLGRFARRYRERYGESPSQTLRAA